MGITHIECRVWREAKEAAEGAGGGVGGAAASAGGGGGGGGGAAAADDDELVHPCPVCLDSEDDAYVGEQHCAQCFACGQLYCGACNTGEGIGQLSNCPTCRAPFDVSDEEKFRRLWKLEHDRSPGRHTPVAQYNLGTM